MFFNCCLLGKLVCKVDCYVSLSHMANSLKKNVNSQLRCCGFIKLVQQATFLNNKFTSAFIFQY